MTSKKQSDKYTAIRLEEFAAGRKVPILPKEVRKKIWTGLKVNINFNITQEAEHFLNIICLHFGLARSSVMIHALNLLWAEVVEGISPEQIKIYEDALEGVRLERLHRLQNTNGANTLEQYAKVAKAIARNRGVSWVYSNRKNKQKKKKES
jgi:hypothetical protein